MEFMENLAGMIASAATVLAAGVAIYGIRTWKREHIGKRRVDLAEEVLALFYEARDAIHDIRSPFGFAGEGATRRADSNEKPEEKEVLDRAYSVFERYEGHRELFSRLHSLRYRFVAQFGSGAAEPFDDLRKVVNEILLSARMLAPLWLKRVAGEIEAEERTEAKRYESIFWAGPSDRDPIAPRIEKAVRRIEQTCGDFIRKS